MYVVKTTSTGYSGLQLFTSYIHILDQERTNQCLSSRLLCAVCQHIRSEYSASNSPAPGMEDVATMTIFDSPKEDSKPGNI